MPYFETLIGTAAAFCTTISYVPQLKKPWTTGETGDLSLKMLLLLAAGRSLWRVYGFMRGDSSLSPRTIDEATLIGPLRVVLDADHAENEIGPPPGLDRRHDPVGKLVLGMEDKLDLLAGLLLEGRDGCCQSNAKRSPTCGRMETLGRQLTPLDQGDRAVA